MIINIPNAFELPFHNGIGSLISHSEPLLIETPYFPEYTSHHSDHVNRVLELTLEVMMPESLTKLSDYQREILVAAIVIHDLGMCIRHAGLQRLIFGADTCYEYDWHHLWSNFHHEARRWDSRKLIDIYGEFRPLADLPDDYIPIEQTKWQRLVYGEFLRRYHHLLAYEISQGHFPGNNCDIDVFTNTEFDKRKRTLVGLIAMSHGTSLRDMEEPIATCGFTITEPIYYLMSLLRIADPLHMGRKRASEIIQLADNMSSPVSRREYEWNQSINEGLPYIDRSTEAIVIDASPKNSVMFLDIKKNLRSLQYEVDMCAAVTLEKHEHDFSLSVRRVKSNIFTPEKMNLNYVAKRAVLDAHPDIAKQMVKPLYGRDPSYGVRELLQNAVDACNERCDLDRKKTEQFMSEPHYEGKIIVEVDTENKIFTITDNGIGMTEDVILDYFLVAGASYRDSAAWRKLHIDNNGEPTLMRSGRFGVGALAAFLIGDSVTVTTRNIDERVAHRFEYTLTPQQLEIEIIKTKNSDATVAVGTTICVKMRENVLADFAENLPDDNEFLGTPYWWQWFWFSEPFVEYRCNGMVLNESRPILTPIPHIDKQDDDTWYYYKPTSELMPYDAIWCTFRNQISSIYCNGIPIFFDNDYNQYSELIGNGYCYPLGNISIIDKNNRLPINISRDRVEKNFKLEGNLVREYFKNHTARLLTCTKSDFNVNNSSTCKGYFGSVFARSNHGYTLSSRTHLLHACCPHPIYIVGFCKDVTLDIIFEELYQIIDIDGAIIASAQMRLNGDADGSNYIIEIIGDGETTGHILATNAFFFCNSKNGEYLNATIEPSLGKMWINDSIEAIADVRTNLYNKFESRAVKFSRKKFEQNDRLQENLTDSIFISSPFDTISSHYKDIRIADFLKKWKLPFLFEYKSIEIDDFDNNPEKNIMLSVLKEYLTPTLNYSGDCPQGLIPYDMAERFRMYPEAFCALRRYIPKNIIEAFEQFNNRLLAANFDN